jgi:CubicO group peptidase (beta-lactamase class C family)
MIDAMRKEEQVTAYLDRLVADRQLTGIQYLVVDGHGVRFAYDGGLRDIGAKLPVTAETTFMAASSTKVLTAAAVLQLAQQSKVDLDNSLSSYYPNHPYGDQVTVRRLLNQSSGIPNPVPLRWLHTVEEHSTFDEEKALQAALRKSPTLVFTPGEKYAYSNISYWLLGMVIQQASGQRYCDYMRIHVFEPLGIAPSELDCSIPDLARHARGYQRKYSLLGLFIYLMMDRRLLDGSEARRFRLKPVYMDGAAYGGLNGTAWAFARFLQDQVRDKPVLLDLTTRALFFSRQKDNRGQELATTLGWHRGQLGDTPYYGKPGGGPGYHSNLRVYPTKALATVWLTNETAVEERSINRFGDTLDRSFVV